MTTNNIARTATLLAFTRSAHLHAEVNEIADNLERTLGAMGGVIFLFVAGVNPALFTDVLFNGGCVCTSTAAMNALHRRAANRLIATGKARVIRSKKNGAYALVSADYKVQEHRNWIDVPTDQAKYYDEVPSLIEAIRAHEDAALEDWARTTAGVKA